MYSSFQIARKYLHYYRTAMNGKGHGMHSPFVFGFILDVLNNRQGYAPPRALEELRRDLLRDRRVLQIRDLGAGSRTGASKERTVAQVAASAVKPRKYGALLHRLVARYKPPVIIELGTSLGLTTAAMASANPPSTVFTIEGSEAVRAVALENFEKLGLPNIRSIAGNFDSSLPQVLADAGSADLVFVDGNHRFEPTLRYFEQLLPLVHNDTILVFDDIHWSREMEDAWAAIKNHPQVRCTIDIFFLGFVLFRSEFRVQQHFTIRY